MIWNPVGKQGSNIFTLFAPWGKVGYPPIQVAGSRWGVRVFLRSEVPLCRPPAYPMSRGSVQERAEWQDLPRARRTWGASCSFLEEGLGHSLLWSFSPVSGVRNRSQLLTGPYSLK